MYVSFFHIYFLNSWLNRKVCHFVSPLAKKKEKSRACVALSMFPLVAISFLFIPHTSRVVQLHCSCHCNSEPCTKKCSMHDLNIMDWNYPSSSAQPDGTTCGSFALCQPTCTCFVISQRVAVQVPQPSIAKSNYAVGPIKTQ